MNDNKMELKMEDFQARFEGRSKEIQNLLLAGYKQITENIS